MWRAYPAHRLNGVKDYFVADDGDHRAVFSRFDLDFDEVVDVPRITGFAAICKEGWTRNLGANGHDRGGLC